MTELLVKPVGVKQTHGKPRVYFTCHPADVERSLNKLSAELLAITECLVFYTADMADRLPEESRVADLERMNLFVIPVSLRLLTEPNRAMDEDFPFAREKKIPILPIMLEPGLDMLYSMENRFGTLQYLDPNELDDTAVSYEDKLKKYLTTSLIDSEMAERVRKAFGVYIFLSYRKKDRNQANQLMRLIHDDPLRQRIAIWFDEYLIPGESFTEAIQRAMQKSELFTLLVTPRILELNENGEPNYVQCTEYPEAKKLGMEMMPAEIEETNRGALEKAFEGLPKPLNILSEKERESYLARLFALARQKTQDDPEHNYLLGLAYLHGIDVEIDRSRALMLITAAGDAELPEAMQALTWMYDEGTNVTLDWGKAAEWAEKLLNYYKRTLGEGDVKTLKAQNHLAYIYVELGKLWESLALYETSYNLSSKALGQADALTLMLLNNLAVAYGNVGKYKEERERLEEVYELRRSLFGEEDPDTLIALRNLAISYTEVHDDEQAKKLLVKAHALQLRTLGERHTDTLKTLCVLASTYRAKEPGQAMRFYRMAYGMLCETLGKTHPLTLQAMYGVANIAMWTGKAKEALAQLKPVYTEFYGRLGEMHPLTMELLRNISLVYMRLGDYPESLKKADRVYQLRSKVLGEKHPDTLESLDDTAFLYRKLGDFQMARERFEKAYRLRCEAMGEMNMETLRSMENIALTLLRGGDKDKEKGRELLLHVHELRRKLSEEL